MFPGKKFGILPCIRPAVKLRKLGIWCCLRDAIVRGRSKWRLDAYRSVRNLQRTNVYSTNHLRIVFLKNTSKWVHDSFCLTRSYYKKKQHQTLSTRSQFFACPTFPCYRRWRRWFARGNFWSQICRSNGLKLEASLGYAGNYYYY